MMETLDFRYAKNVHVQCGMCEELRTTILFINPRYWSNIGSHHCVDDVLACPPSKLDTRTQSLLGQRRRRWTNIKPTLGEYIYFPGCVCLVQGIRLTVHTDR